MMKYRIILSVCTALFLWTGTYAQLATYMFTSGPSEVPTAANVTFSQFSRTGLVAQTAAGAFNSSGFPVTSAVDLAKYVEFTVTADAGYTLTLTSITFGTQKSTQGPASGRIAYNAGGNYTNHFSAVFVPPSSLAATTWDFNDTTTGDGGSVTFRVYGWDAVASGGTLRFDNVAIYGSVAPVSTCQSPSGLNITSITDTSCHVAWGASQGATGYEYAITPGNTPPVGGTPTTLLSHHTQNLTPATAYYFHIRTVCGSTYSAWSSQQFSTTGNTVVSGEIKIMSFNLLNYPGSTGPLRDPKFRTVVTSYEPDIMVVQEVAQPYGIDTFLVNVMNYSSANYSKGTFIDGPDSDNGLFYRTTKFQFISNTAISTALRDINEFTLKLIATGDTLRIYSVHLKSSNTPADEAARAAEIDSLRKRTNKLSPGADFLVCGDFNIYGSAEASYQNMIQSGAVASGKFNDIISMTGSWQSSVNAIHHTQSPRTTAFGGGSTGGMDDRFDMFLFSDGIIQSGGFEIKSNSYLAYGNDGLHYNQALNTAPFNMYPQALAEAIHDCSDHIPVVVTLNYSAVLPVMMRSFNGKIIDEHVMLQWTTVTETNNQSFMIQRSSDAVNWVDVGLVKGSGNSKVPVSYSWTDPEVLSGGIYYRLQQKDYNGKLKLFGPISIAVNALNDDLFRIFPNPVSGNGMVNYSVASTGELEINIFDMLGRAVYKMPQTHVQQGEHLLDLKGLGEGLYDMVVRSNGQILTLRLIVR